MNFSPYQCKERLRTLILDAGAYAVGFAEAVPVDDESCRQYERWTGSGANAGMDYATRYTDVRRDPRLLLEGARTIAIAAFSYATRTHLPSSAPKFARYALGDDYHTALRHRLEPVAQTIRNEYGAECRICIDTAPLRERYWAKRAGLGIIGLNNQLIIPGAGSYFFLASLLTTIALPPDPPAEGDCGHCGRCVAACPGKALDGIGAVNARRCLSYLTIEHRGPLPDSVRLCGRVYGCDICQEVCPHNAGSQPIALPEFEPRQTIADLTREDIARMTQEQFSAIFRNSAVKRTKLAGLQRNLDADK